MPTKPNDGTTTLNAPTVVGGDVLDESLRYQGDGATLVKAARVVLTLDDGRDISLADPLPVALAERELLIEIRDLLRTLVRLQGGI